MPWVLEVTLHLGSELPYNQMVAVGLAAKSVLAERLPDCNVRVWIDRLPLASGGEIAVAYSGPVPYPDDLACRLADFFGAQAADVFANPPEGFPLAASALKVGRDADN